MAKNVKASLANIVCILVTLFIWGLFVAPILVIVYALLSYYMPSFDLSVSYLLLQS